MDAMLRFSANISMLFTEHVLLDRIAAAADAGFGAVEIQFPYDLAADDLARAKERAGIEVSLFNIGVGNLERGGPGLAAMPGRAADFKNAVAQARDYAEALSPLNVNVLAGRPPAEMGRTRCLHQLTDNLCLAAEVFAEIGVGVTLEAVNTRDRPGYLISTSAEALRMIERAGHPNLGLEHDLYHMQIMEGDLVPTLTRLIGRIGNIQFADTPGRGAPGTGEINFPFVLEAVDRLDYEGWMGAEYVPRGPTADSLGWLDPYR